MLHAGFYYAADSLKARFTRDGNRQLTEFCVARGLPINRCGKLVVARTPAELPGLAELLRRGRVNGVPLDDITAADARAIEPRVKTCERALFSPTTSSVDPHAVLNAFVADARSEGITLLPGIAYLGRSGSAVRTTTGTLSPGYVVNAAGLQADRIARDWGFAARWRILPFKGLYLEGAAGSPGFRTHIYPVPDPRQPFLGVHVTLHVDGVVTLGPTAIPAFWREQYAGWSRFSLKEMIEILTREAGLFLQNNFGFRALAIRGDGQVPSQPYRRTRRRAGRGDTPGALPPLGPRRDSRPARGCPGAPAGDGFQVRG